VTCIHVILELYSIAFRMQAFQLQLHVLIKLSADNPGLLTVHYHDYD